MATAPTGTDKPKRKQAPRNNKPRVLFMAYKGQLTGEPSFHFDKEGLIDQMLSDRELQVKKIVVPRGQRRKATPDGATAAPTQVAS